MLAAGKGGGSLAGGGRRAAWCTALALLALLAPACAAQNELSEDPDWTRDPGVESGKWREVQSLFGGEESAADTGKYALRSVRLDLTLSKSAHADARCGCLDVGVGGGRSPKFRWAGEPPSVSRQSLVLALRSGEGSCAQGAAFRRPSIQAVDATDRNVVVVIEDLPFERPQALGAVIGKPRPGGGVYLRAAKGKRSGAVSSGPAGKAGSCRVYYRPGKALEMGGPRR